MSDYQDDYPAPPEEPSTAGPVIAIIIGLGVLIAALVFALMWPASTGALATPERAIELGGRFGMMMLLGILVWAIAFAVTLRRFGGGLKWGTLAGAIFVAGLFGMIDLGSAFAGHVSSRRADESAALNEMRRLVDSDNPEEVTLSETGGPQQRVSAALLNSMLADVRAFNDEAEHAGYERLLGADDIRPGGPELRNCQRFDALGERARRYGDRWQAHVDAGRRVAETAVANGDLRQADLDEYLEGAERGNGRATFTRRWELNAQLSELAGDLCSLLSTRRWTREEERVLFYSDADLMRFNAIVTRVQGAANEQQMLEAQSRANSRAALGRMERR